MGLEDIQEISYDIVLNVKASHGMDALFVYGYDNRKGNGDDKCIGNGEGIGFDNAAAVVAMETVNS